MSDLSEEELKLYNDWYSLLKDTFKEHGRVLPDTFIMRMGEGVTGKDIMNRIVEENPNMTVESAGDETDAKYTVIPIAALLKGIVGRILTSGNPIEPFLADAASHGSIAQNLLMDTIQMLTRAAKAQYAMTILGAMSPAETTNNFARFGQRREVVIFTLERPDGGVWWVDVPVKKKDGKPYVSDEAPPLRPYKGEDNGLLVGMFKEGDSLIKRLSDEFGKTPVTPNWRKGEGMPEDDPFRDNDPMFR